MRWGSCPSLPSLLLHSRLSMPKHLVKYDAHPSVSMLPGLKNMCRRSLSCNSQLNKSLRQSRQQLVEVDTRRYAGWCSPAARPETCTPSRPSTGFASGRGSSDAGSTPLRPRRPYVGRPADSTAPVRISASVWCCPERSSFAPASAGTSVGDHLGSWRCTRLLLSFRSVMVQARCG